MACSRQSFVIISKVVSSMEKLILWALILYKVTAWNTRANYDGDYDDTEVNRRHSLAERRNWRKKILTKDDHNDDVRLGKHEIEAHPYNFDDPDRKGQEMEFIMDPTNKQRRYEDFDQTGPIQKSGEIYDKARKSEIDKKGNTLSMNCDRMHERYETCFAGCAAVTCDNPRERLRPCYPFCEQGCICVPPYVRDDRTHKCVVPENCTKGLKGIPDLNGET